MWQLHWSTPQGSELVPRGQAGNRHLCGPHASVAGWTLVTTSRSTRARPRPGGAIGGRRGLGFSALCASGQHPCLLLLPASTAGSRPAPLHRQGPEHAAGPHPRPQLRRRGLVARPGPTVPENQAVSLVLHVRPRFPQLVNLAHVTPHRPRTRTPQTPEPGVVPGAPPGMRSVEHLPRRAVGRLGRSRRGASGPCARPLPPGQPPSPGQPGHPALPARAGHGAREPGPP